MSGGGDSDLAPNAPRAVQDRERSTGQRGGDDGARAGLDVVRAIGHAGRPAYTSVHELVHPHDAPSPLAT